VFFDFVSDLRILYSDPNRTVSRKSKKIVEKSLMKRVREENEDPDDPLP